MTETLHLSQSLLSAIESDLVVVELDETTEPKDERGCVVFSHNGIDVNVYVGTGEVGFADSGDWVHDSMSPDDYNSVLDLASDLVHSERVALIADSSDM